MPRILITGARAPAALDLARQFAAAGHQVFVADSAPCMLAQSSSSIVRSFRLPPPRQQPAAFAAELQRIICANGIELVVPTCEEVFYVAAFKADLAQHAKIFCPDLPVLKRLHSKWEFTRLLADESLATASVAAPETWLLTSPSGLEAIPGDPADLVFKPEFSRFAVHTLIRPGSDAVGRIPMAPERPWVAQKYVSGREVCSYSIVDGGRVLAHAVYEPAWRAGHGAGMYFQPFAAPEILAFVTHLAAHLNISGQLAFDFIQTGPGQFRVLECNPRATSGVHLFGSGDRLADAFLGTARMAIAPSQARPRMLASAMLLFGIPRALVSGRFRHLARDFRQARDVLWSAADPLPLFYSFAGIAAFAGLALFRRISPQAATTFDIEWDGRPIR